MGGNSSGSQTTKQVIPKWIEDAGKANVEYAQKLNQVGYVPWRGPDVAALTPGMVAGMKNTNDMASAFGMAAPSTPLAGMPDVKTYGGVRGYSGFGMYRQGMRDWRNKAPGQFDAYRDLFMNPRTGKGGYTPPPPGDGGGGGGGGGPAPENPADPRPRPPPYSQDDNSDAARSAWRAYQIALRQWMDRQKKRGAK